MSSQGSQGYQRPGQRQQQAAWGAPGDYAAQAYTQYGYGYKDGYAVPQVAQVPQVQGYYVQGSPGWDGFGGFGYPGGQQAAAAAAYAAAQGYAQPGYGLYGSAFGPVYGQPQQAYAGIPRALPPQSAPAPPGVQNMAPGSRPAPRAGAAVGAPVGTKPVGSGPGTDLDRKQNAGATGNDLEVEIEGGFKSLNTPNGADARLSSSTSIGSELGKDVSGPYEATPGANKSPFGPGVFFGGMGYNDFAREKEDGQEDEEWKEYEARFGIEDLIGGLGGAAKSVAGTEASPERLFTGANVGPATSSSITSGPPPGLGPAANTSIGRNGSLSDLASTTGSAVVDDTAVPAAAKDAGFQLPSWGTSIGALGGALVAEKAGYDVASNLAQLSIDAAPQMVESVKDEIARPAVSAVGAAIAPVQSPVAAEAPKPIPAPATDEPRKPMSWAAIAKTPAKPSEVKPAGPVVQKPATWAAAAKAPAAPIPIGGGPGRRLVGNEDPKSLVAEMFAERGINPKTFNVKPVNVSIKHSGRRAGFTDASECYRPSFSSSSRIPKMTFTNRSSIRFGLRRKLATGAWTQLSWKVPGLRFTCFSPSMRPVTFAVWPKCLRALTGTRIPPFGHRTGSGKVSLRSSGFSLRMCRTAH